MRLEEGDHLASDIALVEPVAGRGNARGASAAGGRALGLDHARQRARQIGQPDRLARDVGGTVRLEPHGPVVRPGLHECPRFLGVDRRNRARPQRKPPIRIFDGARRHLLEAHRAPALENGQRRMEHTGHHRRIESGARHRLALRKVGLERRAPRRPADTVDGDHLSRALRIHQRCALAAQAVQVLLHDAAHQHGRDAGVERIPAFHQQLERRRRRQGMPRRHGAIWPDDGRPKRPGRRQRLRRGRRDGRRRRRLAAATGRAGHGESHSRRNHPPGRPTGDREHAHPRT